MIERQAVEEALLGFQFLNIAEVLMDRPVHGDAFINRFTSLWRGTERVSIRNIGDQKFLIRFVAKRDMQRVIDSEFPWTFRDDVILLGDCTHKREASWNALTMGDMWVQIHKVPPWSMTAVVASAIGGKIGSVLRVDKSASRECIGRFLRVRIRFNLREPLMRGLMVTFPDEGRVWVEFRYEGLPNYCLHCEKLGHEGRACTTLVGDDDSMKGNVPFHMQGWMHA